MKPLVELAEEHKGKKWDDEQIKELYSQTKFFGHLLSARNRGRRIA